MAQDRNTGAVTRVSGAVHNPADARHFMKIRPVAGRVRVERAGRLLAETDAALRVLEVGNDLYDPTIYIPRADLRVALETTAHSTHCPLKGTTRYLSLPDAGGAAGCAQIAWSYVETLPGAEALKDLVAFDPRKVTITESGHEQPQPD